MARAFYSRNWQLRDAALQYLAELVRGGNVSDRRELCRSLVRLVVRSLRDKVPNVFFSTLPLLQALLATLAASASSREVSGLRCAGWRGAGSVLAVLLSTPVALCICASLACGMTCTILTKAPWATPYPTTCNCRACLHPPLAPHTHP